MPFTSPKLVIRANSLINDLYMQRDGTFGPYKTARRFATDAKADAFAASHGVAVYGLFPCSAPRRKPG